MRRRGLSARTARKARSTPSPALPGTKLTVDTTTIKKSRSRQGEAKYDDGSPNKPRAMNWHMRGGGAGPAATTLCFPRDARLSYLQNHFNPKNDEDCYVATENGRHSETARSCASV